MLTEKFDMFVYKYLEELNFGPNARHSTNVQNVVGIPAHLQPMAAPRADFWRKGTPESDKASNDVNIFKKIEQFRDKKGITPMSNYVGQNQANPLTPTTTGLAQHWQQQTVQQPMAQQPVAQPAPIRPMPQMPHPQQPGHPLEVNELSSSLPNG